MNLRVNYEQLRTLGTNVGNKGGEFQQLLDKIKSINTELQSYWEGSDATKYTNAVNEQAKTMQDLADTISEISQFLIKAGDAYEQVANDNASAIN